MATKKEIKQILKELNLTELEMDALWEDLRETNWKVGALERAGKTWRDMNGEVIKQIPTQKERDIQAAEKERTKLEEKLAAEAKAKADREYYSTHFEEIMLDKITAGEDLTERELQELVWNGTVLEYGDNRRWSRGVTSLVELGGRKFAIDWEEGLTESQENEYYNQPYEVEMKQYEKTITVTEWVKK